MAKPDIIFKQIYIRFLSNDAVEVRWELEPTNEDTSKIFFEVLRSESPQEGFFVISPQLTDLCIYRDYYDSAHISKWNLYYYKIRAAFLATPTEFTEAEPEYIHENPFDDGQSAFIDPVIDIVRRHNELLSHGRYRIGKPCVIYQKRTGGPRNCSCWDPILQRVTVSGCARCYGTGKVEGYHAGIDEIFVAFVSLPKQKLIQQWGDIEPSDTQAWMTNFPIARPEDIIINKFSNEHWLVKRVRTSVHLIVSRQTLLVRKLNFDDVKTKLGFETTKFRI